MTKLKWKRIEPLDRLAITLTIVLSITIGLLLWHGANTGGRVRSFTWQDKQIGAEDNRFIITFNRPMDRASVEEKLQINPPLLGKFSWAGLKMAYTLVSPAPYGFEYEVQLKEATDKFAKLGEKGTPIKPFTGKFKTRDRAFVYLGVEGNEAGRLMLVNFSALQPKAIALTPPELVVSDFKAYPNSDRILFSANDRTFQRQGVLEQNLYTVTTGIANRSPDEESRKSKPAGLVKLILDNKDYQNLKFDLSADGKIIAVQRVNRIDLEDFAIWIVKMDGDRNDRPTAKPLGGKGGGDFLITPDSKAVAIAQGQGLAIVPLEGSQDKPLDFLPKFGTVASFSRDGTEAAMVKFNTDYTRSLYLVTNRGVEKELLRITGSILNAQFDPNGENIYCLLTKLIADEQYREQPYVAVINLKTAQMKPLLLLPNQRQVQMSLSPDGIVLLLDQPVTAPLEAGQQSDAPRSDSGEAVTDSSLWLLPLISNESSDAPDTQIKPERLPIHGFRPQWLP